MKTTQQILDEIALQEGFRYFEDLMRHASLSYIQDRVKKAMLLFAEQVREEDRSYIIEYYNDALLNSEQIVNTPKLELK